MAVLRTPRCTTSQRMALILDVSEIVFDTDESNFYGGDGETPGGFLIGGGQLKDAGFIIQYINITQEMLNNKSVTLAEMPINPDSVMLRFKDGLDQMIDVDYEVTENVVSWSGLGLDGFLDLEDVLVVEYLVWDGLTNIVQQITLSDIDVQNKQVTLLKSPTNPSSVRLTIDGGISQVNGIDFMVLENVLSWDGFELDNFLEKDDIIIVQY
jgi:hypothetical protein